MVDICPTVTINEPHAYRSYMEKIAEFAVRIHIDLADGSLTPNRLLPLEQIWWPGGVRADLHVMNQRPFEHLELIMALSPQLVIVQAEAEGDFNQFASRLHHHGMEVGVALLAKTPAQLIVSAIDQIDHVLIFSGDFGSYGGHADTGLLTKVAELRAIKPQLEIGWDGGINDQNAKTLVAGGIDVLNVGGYIAESANPSEAFAALQTALGGAS